MWPFLLRPRRGAHSFCRAAHEKKPFWPRSSSLLPRRAVEKKPRLYTSTTNSDLSRFTARAKVCIHEVSERIWCIFERVFSVLLHFCIFWRRLRGDQRRGRRFGPLGRDIVVRPFELDRQQFNLSRLKKFERLFDDFYDIFRPLYWETWTMRSFKRTFTANHKIVEQ